MKKIVLRICGVGLLVLGLIGAFMPILPTTPFVLAGSGILGSSSPKLLSQLERTRYFGEFIRNYKHKSGISNRTRIISLCWLWGSLCLSATLSASRHISLVLICVGIAVSVHVLTIAPKKRRN